MTNDTLADESEHLRHVLDRDRYIVAAVVGSIRKAIAGYQWLLGEGRGSYEWDDDRFRDEFRHAVDAIEEAAKPLAHVGWDKTDCTRIEERVEAARLAAREVLNRPLPKRDMIAADLGLPCAYCTSLRTPPTSTDERKDVLANLLDALKQEGSHGSTNTNGCAVCLAIYQARILPTLTDAPNSQEGD